MYSPFHYAPTQPNYTASVVYICAILVITAQFLSRRTFLKAEEQTVLFPIWGFNVTVQVRLFLLWVHLYLHPY